MHGFPIWDWLPVLEKDFFFLIRVVFISFYRLDPHTFSFFRLLQITTQPLTASILTFTFTMKISILLIPLGIATLVLADGDSTTSVFEVPLVRNPTYRGDFQAQMQKMRNRYNQQKRVYSKPLRDPLLAECRG